MNFIRHSFDAITARDSNDASYRGPYSASVAMIDLRRLVHHNEEFFKQNKTARIDARTAPADRSTLLANDGEPM